MMKTLNPFSDQAYICMYAYLKKTALSLSEEFDGLLLERHNSIANTLELKSFLH